MMASQQKGLYFLCPECPTAEGKRDRERERETERQRETGREALFVSWPLFTFWAKGCNIKSQLPPLQEIKSHLSRCWSNKDQARLPPPRSKSKNRKRTCKINHTPRSPARQTVARRRSVLAVASTSVLPLRASERWHKG